MFVHALDLAQRTYSRRQVTRDSRPRGVLRLRRAAPSGARHLRKAAPSAAARVAPDRPPPSQDRLVPPGAEQGRHGGGRCIPAGRPAEAGSLDPSHRDKPRRDRTDRQPGLVGGHLLILPHGSVLGPAVIDISLFSPEVRQRLDVVGVPTPLVGHCHGGGQQGQREGRGAEDVLHGRLAVCRGSWRPHP